MMQKLGEECGVFGVFSPTTADVALTTYYGLFALQHRGQETSGITVNNQGVFSTYRDVGLVRDIFTRETLTGLGNGNIAVGHVRYGTMGDRGRINAQPVVVNHIEGALAIAHNGNLVNARELRRNLELSGAIFHMTSDTEVISHLIIRERLKTSSIQEAISRAMDKIKGAYSLVISSTSKLIAVRDPHGFRPLCYGETEDGRYIVASESCALDAVGATFVREIEPGEIVIFGSEGVQTLRDHCEKAQPALCIFEYIYFARPDSVIGGYSVQQARIRAGELLAKAHPAEADIVIGVPDSGIDAAIGYSRYANIPYGVGLIKNKYIARTFIEPGQRAREDKVRIKLNAVRNAVEGKRVVMVDDSIVRGTTCRHIVKLLRDSGATEVHMRVSAPPFIGPCYYGTDIPSREELIACQYTCEETAAQIGVDSLGYLEVEDVTKVPGEGCGEAFCKSCFTGNYFHA